MEYILKSITNEDRRRPLIYCVKFFNDPLPSTSQIFASCGTNSAMVYRVDSDDNLQLVQSFVDEDIEENYFTCDWSMNEDGVPLLAVAGNRGIIKIFNCIDYKMESVLIGHGNSINEIKVHPIEDYLLFSASKDKSIRLWNIRTSVCIAILAGDDGHKNEVLSLDVHMLGNCLATSSMDTSVKIWNLRDPDLQQMINLSCEKPDPDRSFPTCILQDPLYTTNMIHTDYVDSVKWVGDCLLTKSTKQRVVLWSPDSMRYKGAPMILQEYSLPHSAMWFIKMDIFLPFNIFAVGNTKGKVCLYPLTKLDKRPSAASSSSASSEEDPPVVNPRDKDGLLLNQERFQTNNPTQPLCTLGYHKTQATVRQVTFSGNGRYLVSCFDDGSIHLWACKLNSSGSIKIAN